MAEINDNGTEELAAKVVAWLNLEYGENPEPGGCDACSKENMRIFIEWVEGKDMVVNDSQDESTWFFRHPDGTTRIGLKALNLK